MLPAIGLCTAVVVLSAVLGRVFTGRQAYYQDGHLVSVRYPGQRHDMREFVQPHNPEVIAVYSQFGPEYWALYDFVCLNINYRRDWGEFFQWPSETIARRQGDCEDSAILLTSLIRAGGVPNCHVALGSLEGYGHAWCELDGQILETTYTFAQPVPDPQDYCPFCLFSESQMVELWPGALGEVFELARDEEAKFSLIAKALEAVAC